MHSLGHSLHTYDEQRRRFIVSQEARKYEICPLGNPYFCYVEDDTLYRQLECAQDGMWFLPTDEPPPGIPEGKA